MPAMTLEDRIVYWRGRAKLARKLALPAEMEAANQIVETLEGLRKHIRETDAKVDRIHDRMPEEMYTFD